MDTKRCYACGEHKPYGEFYMSSKSADGLRYQCKGCSSAERAKWRSENPDKVAEQKRRYKSNNPDKVRAQKARTQARRLSRSSGRIDADIRTALNADMRCIARYGKDVYGLLGYDAKQLMDALEDKFKPGMTWDNYGVNGWHIDHVFPLNGVKYDSPDDPEFAKVWSIGNLQPLWAEENIAKGDKLTVE